MPNMKATAEATLVGDKLATPPELCIGPLHVRRAEIGVANLAQTGAASMCPPAKHHSTHT
jgi:hypothetical protein